MTATKDKTGGIDQKLYLDERKELYKYQQANYDSFEKTLLTLSGSFLAFSIGFLGFLSRGTDPSRSVLSPGSGQFLLACWILFAASLVALLVCSFVNVRAYTVEIIRLEDARHDSAALDRPNHWRTCSLVLYTVSTFAFLAGLVSLLLFCKRNFSV